MLHFLRNSSYFVRHFSNSRGSVVDGAGGFLREAQEPNKSFRGLCAGELDKLYGRLGFSREVKLEVMLDLAKLNALTVEL